MRKYLCLALGVVATLTAMVGCSYDDDAIWTKFEEIESEVDQNRNDIETLTALMEALSSGKVIVSVETTEDGVVLTFSDGSTVTVYNGQDGEDGKDGADGEDGKDGKDGQDGEDGEDGQDGQDGDSIFESVEETDTEVIITLTDGRVIRLPKSTDGGGNEEGNEGGNEGEMYELRILTFEDNDARFAPYTLYGGAEITTWSSLIDDMQYGGSLTYTDYVNDLYYWYDEGNTELFHSFVTPYWQGGHVISNYVIEDYATLPEGYYGWYELQMSNPIGGHNGSANFAVHNGYSDFYNSQIYDSSLQTLEFADGVERVVDHMYVTNTCYMLNSLTYGDGFNSPATADTWIKVVAYGYNANEEETGSVEITLCDGVDNILNEWTKWDLSPLGKVVKIAFNFKASDDQIGSYGMNCPAYFAYDDVAVRWEAND